MNRRQFVASAAGLVAGTASVDGFLLEPRRIQVTRHDLPIRALPDALEGLRIAHVTDLHLHGGGHAAAESTMRLLAEERPEIVLMTGDMCERLSVLPELTAFLREAKGSLATVATLGNWEYWGHVVGAPADSAYSRGGAELLVNGSHSVRVGRATISIVGLDDPRAGRPDLAGALGHSVPGDLSIWLLHAPGYVDELPRTLATPPALILAGHTHGGQIRIPGLPPYLPWGSGRFVSGWYRDTYAPLYVSRGVGTSAVRARLFCPPEIALFTLKRA